MLLHDFIKRLQFLEQDLSELLQIVWIRSLQIIIMFAPPAETAEASKLIEAIRDQTQGVPDNLVFVIDIVSVRFGGYFTPAIKAELQRFRYLQMLTLNDCGIKSLENFPDLRSLIRLDVVFNQITGQSLRCIAHSRHLQTLMLGANLIQKIQHLQPLTIMKQLLQLDLINNPVSLLPGYRNTIFTMFPTLTILDTLDKSGKDAYNNSSMVQTVARVPETLFDKGPDIVPVVVPPRVDPPKKVKAKHEEIKKREETKLKTALSRAGSLGSMKGQKKQDKKVAKKVIKKAQLPVRAKGGKASKGPINSSSRTASSRSGLLFPVGRIKRKIREALPGVRVGKNSAVYMAAILQYLSAQLLQIAGNQAKKDKKQRITPQFIKRCLKYDEQLNNVLKNVTIGMNNP